MAVDKKVPELDPIPQLLDEHLLIISDPNTGRLYKTTLADLKDFLGYVAALPKLSTPQITIVQVTATTIEISIVGDAHTVNHVLRLATDAQFNSVIRNATVVAPQASFTFTGLPSATAFYIELIDKAAGYTDSDPDTETATTSSSGGGTTYTYSLYYGQDDPWLGAGLVPQMQNMTLLKTGTISSVTADIVISKTTTGFANLLDSYWVLKLQKAITTPIQQVNDQFNSFAIPGGRYRNNVPEDATDKYLVTVDLMGIDVNTDLTYKLQ